MMKKNDIGIYFITLTNSLFIFFGYMITNLYFLQIFQIIFIIFFFKFHKVKISKSDKIFFVICILLLISSFISGDINNSMEFVAMFLMVGIQKILLSNIEGWEEINIIFLRIFSSIHVIATLLQFLNPNLITWLNSFLLNNENYLSNSFLLKLGAYAGITGQTGINAFFITIFIIVISTEICYLSGNHNNHKVFNYFWLLLGFSALLLTAKRMFFIISFLITAYNFMSFRTKNNKNKYKKIIISLLVFLVFVCILNYLGMFNTLFEKTAVLSSNNDIFNGREELWSTSFNIFLRHPILGIGINTLGSKYYIFAHNIYIQILAELGIIGFSFFIFYFIFNLKIKKTNNIIWKYGFIFQLLFLIYGFSGNPLYGHVYITIYFLGICLCEKGGKENEDRYINLQ